LIKIQSKFCCAGKEIPVPHIIVEYAEEVLNHAQLDTVLQTIHQSIAQSGLFAADQIKTRAYAFKKFTNAGGNDPYIHIQARIKSGRDAGNKKQLGEVILKGLSTLPIPASVLTVEIIDMDRESYGKYSPG
jgi:5-carboxymethyl-2-hydroxymuconate isomerase